MLWKNDKVVGTPGIEQDVYQKRKMKMPNMIFLIGKEKLGEDKRRRVDGFLDKYPSLKEFY